MIDMEAEHIKNLTHCLVEKGKIYSSYPKILKESKIGNELMEEMNSLINEIKGFLFILKKTNPEEYKNLNDEINKIIGRK